MFEEKSGGFTLFSMGYRERKEFFIEDHSNLQIEDCTNAHDDISVISVIPIRFNMYDTSLRQHKISLSNFSNRHERLSRLCVN